MNLKIKTKKIVPLAIFVALSGLFGVSYAFGQTAVPEVTNSSASSATDPIADLNAQIAAKKKHVEELRQQAENYQKSAEAASGQVHDFQSQISVIDDQIANLQFDIQAKEEEIGATELEITAIQRSIDDKLNQINGRKTDLVSSIKQLDQNSRTPLLNVLLTHSTLAEFYSQAEAVATVSDSLQNSVNTLEGLKDELQSKQNELSDSRDILKQSKLQLLVKKQSSVEQKDFKEELLGDAKSAASQYGSRLQEAAQAEQQANATIDTLERQLQQQLTQGTIEPPKFSSSGVHWPVNGSVTARFHDPTYPFSCANWNSGSCLEHSGLDIGVPQGTPVRAAADGVVSVVNNQGFYYNTNGQKTRSALNFVGLVHEQGISTRYLHLTTIHVRPDQFVRQGEVIGLSGGLPGTAGAGGITTGPHLHFEVRVNGLPDDPLKYLP